jgi:hypothetical protein
MRLTLCLLTLNELAGCQHDVPRLERERFEETYAIDGGSSDGTVEYLQSQGIPVYRQDEPGYSNSYFSAFGHCSTDALILFHPKATINPDATLEFRHHLEAGNDLVIASRVIAGARNEEDDRIVKPRKWFVIAVAATAAVLWRREGNMVWDPLHGCRAMRRDCFYAIDPRPYGLSVDLEMVVRSYRKRLKRIEFPVHERPRPDGETHFRSLPTGFRHLRYLAHELTRPA